VSNKAKVYWITLEEECHDTCSSNWNRWCLGDMHFDSNSFTVSKVDDIENMYDDI